MPAVPPLRPTKALPGLHVVCPGRWDGVATTYALHRCGWKRTGIGRDETEAIVRAYREHAAACNPTPKEGK